MEQKRTMTKEIVSPRKETFTQRLFIIALDSSQRSSRRSFYRALQKFRAVKRLKSVYIVASASAMEELVTLARYYGLEPKAFEVVGEAC